MLEQNISNYFYGDGTIRFSYFRIPRQLITHPLFKTLSADAKILYSILLNRVSLFAKNGWHDSEGRVYIYYTVKEVCAAIGCGRNKAMRLLAELDACKGIGLIERIKQGQGKPDRIFVKRITVQEDTGAPNQDPAASVSEDGLSDAQRSGKSTSSRLENRPLEVSKANPSYIDKNQTDFIHTNQSINPPTPSTERLEIDGYEAGEEPKENGMYHALQQELCTVNAYSIRFWEIRLTVRRIFYGHTKRTATRLCHSGQRRLSAALSGQVCHLVAHQMTLVRGRSPLKTPSIRNASHGETHYSSPPKGCEKTHEKTKPPYQRVDERAGIPPSKKAGRACGTGD